jgi:drug/metabolite transporter (DMT)-like permease
VAPRRISSIDALLLLMTLIWGLNYSIVKTAFQQIDPQAFNAVRMLVGSMTFLMVIALARHLRASGPLGSIFATPAPITRRDWVSLGLLGLVGHTAYQYFFIGGLARTSVANSSLMLAATPVVIALISAAMGHERIGRLHWLGAALSVVGIYLVVGRGPKSGGASVVGDAMMFAAVVCWAIYTLGARHLMLRHSPVGITGLSMAIGTAIYVPLLSINLWRTQWGTLTVGTWAALLYSALFALCVAYSIWYIAVREIGSARTSVYSNLVPIVAMVTAIITLGEKLTPTRLTGAAAVLLGVALTRVGKTAPLVPQEE